MAAAAYHILRCLGPGGFVTHVHHALFETTATPVG